MIIEARGRYFWSRRRHTEEDHETQVLKDMEDMLRYDQGKVLNIDVNPENRTYTAIVEIKTYTPERWKSFGIETKPSSGVIDSMGHVHDLSKSDPYDDPGVIGYDRY